MTSVFISLIVWSVLVLISLVIAKIKTNHNKKFIPSEMYLKVTWHNRTHICIENPNVTYKRTGGRG